MSGSIFRESQKKTDVLDVKGWRYKIRNKVGEEDGGGTANRK